MVDYSRDEYAEDMKAQNLSSSYFWMVNSLVEAKKYSHESIALLEMDNGDNSVDN